MGRPSTWIGVVLGLIFILGGVPHANAIDYMYWADNGTDKIQRANLDGTSVTDLVTGLNDPFGIALDVANNHMYWRDSGKIQRANLDGTGVTDLVTGLSGSAGIALDVANNHMYWTDSGKIQRANLDGTGVTDLVTGLIAPFGIALDVANNHMYWTDISTSKIQRANLNGMGVTDLVTGLALTFGIALDVANNHMYWTNAVTGKIQRANLDGTGVTDLAALSDPFGIALDVASNHMYWTDNGTDKIQRANLNGTGITDLVTGLSAPNFIALQTASLVPELSCIGFDSPMDKTVTVKKNRVLSLKAQLLDSDSNPITDNDIVALPVLQVTFYSGMAPAEDVTDEALSAGQGMDGNQFVFDIDEWRFNLKTKNYTASGTYTITMKSGDTDEYTIIDPTCTGTFVIY